MEGPKIVWGRPIATVTLSAMQMPDNQLLLVEKGRPGTAALRRPLRPRTNAQMIPFMVVAAKSVPTRLALESGELLDVPRGMMDAHHILGLDLASIPARQVNAILVRNFLQNFKESEITRWGGSQ